MESDNDLNLSKLKCVKEKYANDETMKNTSSSGIDKAIYHNSTDLFFFVKGQWKYFEISYCNSFYLKHAAPLLLSVTVAVNNCYTSFKILK